MFKLRPTKDAQPQLEKLAVLAPTKIVAEGPEKGIELSASLRAHRVPDRAIRAGDKPRDVAGPGTPVYPDANPWPAPVARVPYKLKGA